MPRPKRTGAQPRVISELLSSRLHSLAALSAANASLRVGRKFSLTLHEWRSIGQLGGFAPLSLKELARRAGLDKSYASRTVTALIDRGLVASERNGADARGVMLSLTPEGQALYCKVFADAVARNERLLSPLTAAQRGELLEMLAALTVSAHRVLDDERRAAAGEAVDETAPIEPGRGRAMPANGSNLDLGEIRYIVSRLNELVGK